MDGAAQAPEASAGLSALRLQANRYRFFDLMVEPQPGEDPYAPTLREARRLLEQAAAEGDVDAMLDLGDFLGGELGPGNDPQAAERWYERAALVSGRADAQNRLGVLLDRSRRYAEARIWYERAAAQGHANAQFNMAMLHRRGQGAERSDAAAMGWLERAAAQGDGIAAWHAGEICEDVASPLYDAAQAERWYALALERGVAEAAFRLGRLLFRAGRFPEAAPLLRQALKLGGPLSRQAQQLLELFPPA